MPLYTYKCKTCDIKQDVHHGMNDAPDILCIECGEPCIKIPSVGSVTFKGSGWGSD